MSYVLDYSSFYWQRKAAIRRAAIAAVVAALAAAAGVGLWIRSVSLRPTFAEVVSLGYVPRGASESERVEPLERTAAKVYKVADAWAALRNDFEYWSQYLRLVWSPPGAAFTNALDAVAAMAAAPGVPRAESASSPALAIETADVFFAPFSVEGAVSDRKKGESAGSRPLTLSVKWRTLAPFSPEKGVEIRDFATNAVSLAPRPWTAASAPSAASLSFADGGKAAEPVAASWTLPGPPVLPVSPQLAAATQALGAMSAALRTMKLGAAPKGYTEEPTFEVLKTLLDSRARGSFESRKKEYERMLDPGAWLAGSFAPEAFAFNAQPFARELYGRWAKATKGRMPWERSEMDSFMRGTNFVSPQALREFAARLPPVGDINASRAALAAKTSGLTNALSAALFAPFDATPAEKRATEHDTVNLLSFDAETGVLPPGTLPVPAAPQGAVQSFTVRFPTPVNSGGRHLEVGGKVDRTARCTFAKWNYSLVSTNAPVSAADVADGLREFFGAGWGYEPEIAAMKFSEDGGVVRFDASGIVPVLLDGSAPLDSEK